MIKSSLLGSISFIEHGFLNAKESEDIYLRLPLLRLNQVHSSEVYIYGKEIPKFYPDADGAVTKESLLYLSIRTADCVPILFSSFRDKVIGVAHAGWKGAIGGIISSTVENMVSLGARREEIYAAIGPCILCSSYEVKEDFYKLFLSKDRSSTDYFTSDRSHFDLSGYVGKKLRESGLSKIDFCGIDTFKDMNFHSYRRDNFDRGRNISYIMIKE